MDAVVFPDSATLVINELTELVEAPGYGQTPNPRPTTFWSVRRIGGPRATIVSDQAQLLIEAWGANDIAAHDLAQLLRAHTLAMTGRILDGHQVYRVDELSGPSQDPDPDSGQSRYSSQVWFCVRGTVLEPGS